MLAVGGNLDVSSESTTSVQVGRFPDPVGKYIVGGTVSNPEKFNVGEHAPFDLVGTTADGFGAKVVFASSAFATADDTGSYTSDGGAQATVTFEGDGTSEL